MWIWGRGTGRKGGRENCDLDVLKTKKSCLFKEKEKIESKRKDKTLKHIPVAFFLMGVQRQWIRFIHNLSKYGSYQRKTFVGF